MSERRFVSLASLVCDDIRKEVSGKDILIGVFAYNVYMGIIPANVIASLYIRMLFGKQGQSIVNFRIMGPRNIQVTPDSAIPFTSPPNLDDITVVYLNRIQFQVQSEGVYEFQWKPPDQEWESLTSLHFKGGQMSQPSAFIPDQSAASTSG